MVKHINPDGMYKTPVYSQGILIPASARVLLIGGQNGVDDKGQVVAKDLAGQTAKAVDNLIKVLEAAGGTLDDLIKVGIHLKGDEDIRPGFEEWMKRAKGMKNPPIVTALRVQGLANPDFLIEIDGMAVLK